MQRKVTLSKVSKERLHYFAKVLSCPRENRVLLCFSTKRKSYFCNSTQGTEPMKREFVKIVKFSLLTDFVIKFIIHENLFRNIKIESLSGRILLQRSYEQ